MKLLIVDDEELTRTGVISSIDWPSIGIQEVLQADDGMNGIEVARVHRPDIVLCDVRMPRMELPCWNAWRRFSRILFLFL